MFYISDFMTEYNGCHIGQLIINTTMRNKTGWRKSPKQLIKLNLKLSLYPLIETAELAHQHFFSKDMPQEQVNRYYQKMGDESYRTFLDMMLLNLPRPEHVKTPLLVLGARDDAIFTVNEVKATARAYNTQPHFFPMAHDMMLEPGWEQVAHKMLAWLEKRGVE